MLETPIHEIRSRDLPIVALPRVQLHADFQVILGGALALTVLVALGDRVPILEPIRLLLALAYVLYIPGYCLVCALFPSAADLDGIERLGLNFSLSVATVPLVALLLSILPWGLRPAPILLGELGATALYAGIATWRRAQLSENLFQIAISFEWQPRAVWKRMEPGERRAVAAFAAVLALVLAISVATLTARATANFTTEFSIIGASGSANDYPTITTPNQPIRVTASVVNRERDAHSYRIETWVVDGWNPSHRLRVLQTEAIRLSPGETRRLPLSWVMPWPGDDQEVEFLLYADDRAEPYRRLRIWLNVVGSSSASQSHDNASVSSFPAAFPAPP